MKWGNLRVNSVTARRLAEARLVLQADIIDRPHRYPEWMYGKRLSRGDVIEVLLDRLDAARLRARQRGREYGYRGHGRRCTIFPDD